MIAARELPERFPELPDDVWQAIDRHTLGNAHMSPLDMVVFVADGIEPLRKPADAIKRQRKLVGKASLSDLYWECFSDGRLLRHRDEALPVSGHALYLQRYRAREGSGEGRQMTTSIDIAREAAMAADDKKASGVVVLDVRGISDVVDAIVVCTAANSRLAGAVVDEVEERLRLRFGLSALSVSGKGDGPWVLVDFAQRFRPRLLSRGPRLLPHRAPGGEMLPASTLQLTRLIRRNRARRLGVLLVLGLGVRRGLPQPDIPPKGHGLVAEAITQRVRRAVGGPSWTLASEPAAGHRTVPAGEGRGPRSPRRPPR